MIERDGLIVEVRADGITVSRGERGYDLIIDEARWMQAVALPAALAEAGRLVRIPSDGPEQSDEQIPGQLAIE